MGDDGAGLLHASNTLAVDAREKQALRESLEAKEKELVSVKSRNYDLVKEKEALELEVARLQAQQCQSTGRRKPKIRTGKRKKPGKKKSAVNEGSNQVEAANREEHDSEKFYQTIADRFPRLYISSVLLAEKKFQTADVDGDGTIDYNELEAILDKSGCLFTQKEVREILSSIDVDQSESIDFMECLEVLSRLQENKPTRVAHGQVLAKNSGICAIQ